VTEKKANHQVNIVCLGEPLVHPNADSLELFDIGEYQVVTKKGEFKAGPDNPYIGIHTEQHCSNLKTCQPHKR